MMHSSRFVVLLLVAPASAMLEAGQSPPYAWTDALALNSEATLDTGWGDDSQLTTDGGGKWVAVWDSNDDVGGTTLIGLDDQDIHHSTCSPLLDDCTDEADDAWPPDTASWDSGCGDPDTTVNILDVCCYKPKLNYCESEGGYDPRYNLEFTESRGCTPTEQQVNILDVLMYKPVLNASCTSP